MSLISIPRRIVVAGKNLGRLSQIVQVFWKYGFGEFAEKVGFKNYLPSRVRAKIDLLPETTAARLRSVFEELGPTFVKLGQLLSTRQDLFPEEFLQEMAKLQDQVPGVPFSDIEQVLRQEWKQDWNNVLHSLDTVALASASIAQVHRGVLLSGQEVVLKIQRPKIRETIIQDSYLLNTVAASLEKYIPELRPYSIKGLIEEFTLNLRNELNFTLEAGFVQRMRKNFAEWPQIKIPEVHAQYSTSRVLVEELIRGIRISDQAQLKAQGVDIAGLVDVAARSFFKMLMKDGLFHGDLHPGNLFVQPPNTIAMIDFGSVGVLSEKSRDLIVSMLVALSREDYETLAYDFLEMSGSSGIGVDAEEFAREIRLLVSPYLGISGDQSNYGGLLLQATRIAAKYVRIPSEWFLVFKAIATIEGMAKTVDPKFNTMEIGLSYVKDVIQHRINKDRFFHELAFVSRDIYDLVRTLPREMRWIVRAYRSRKYGFSVENPESQAMKNAFGEMGNRIARSIGGVGIILGSVSLMTSANWYPDSAVLHHLLPLAGIGLGLILILIPSRK